MRLLTSVATLATAVVWSPLTATNAFVVLLPASTSTARSPVPLIRAIVGDNDRSQTVCDIPLEFDGGTPSLVGVTDGANAIRSAVVTNSAGDFVRIDDAIKFGKAGAAARDAPHVVVYLRHMG